VKKLLFERLLTNEGWRETVLVSIEAEMIRSLQFGASPAEAAGALNVNGFAMAGTGNLHSHTFQRGFAGLTERKGSGEDHFWTWRDAMYRFVGALTPEDVEAIAALAFVEMLESGYTAVAEFHYLHHQQDGHPYANVAELSQRIIAAAARTGIGLTLLPVFYAHGGFNGAAPSPGQRRFICDREQYAALHENAKQALRGLSNSQIGIAPHSLRAVTGDEIIDLAANYPTGPVHLHIAEQIQEVDECVASTGARPVQWLLDHLDVTSRWCLIHATHMTPSETQRAAASGAVAGLCPVTESNLGDGIFPATEFVAHGGTFGVGTDSNICISLVEELRMLEYSQRLRDRRRNRLTAQNRSTGRFLFDAASTAGGQALGLQIGQVAPRFRADFVVLDEDPNFFACRNGDVVLDSWIFASNRSPIRDVFIGGNKVVECGRHLRRDGIEITWRAAMQRLAAG
jgi:formimidoylglutamate deiminase